MIEHHVLENLFATHTFLVPGFTVIPIESTLIPDSCDDDDENAGFC